MVHPPQNLINLTILKTGRIFKPLTGEKQKRVTFWATLLLCSVTLIGA
jgi:hypothetical protein